MGRKTLILTESQFNEICGTNTAYLDNPGDYTADGTIHMRTDGSVRNSYGGREDYSEPPTTSDIANSMAPETLFALLFRNGGHGLWGHWGSGLRAGNLDGFDNDFDEPDDDDHGDGKINIDDPEVIRNIIDILQDTLGKYEDDEEDEDDEEFDSNDEDEYDEDEEDDEEDEDEEYLFESNSDLEGRSWNGNSYTNLTTKKSQYKQQLAALRGQNAPAQLIKRVSAAYNDVSQIVDNATKAVRDQKKARMNAGMPNQFQKAGGTKNSGNGKAHTRKKTVDPNVGTGFITYK